MQRNFFVSAAILFSMICPAIAQNTRVAEEKPLRFWIQQLNDSDPMVRRKAAEVLSSKAEEFGVWDDGFFEAEWIKRRAAFRQEAKRLLPELLKVLRNDDDPLRDEYAAIVAAELIMALGPDSRTAQPDLEEIVLNNKASGMLRMMCAYALLTVIPEDEPVGPLVLKMLNALSIEQFEELNGDAQLEGDDTAKRIFGDGKRGIVAMRHNSVATSIPAYAVPLANSGHTKIEVPYLVKIALGAYPPMIRAMAIGTLGALGFDAKSAVPALQKLLKDEDRFVRVWAASSLMTIERDEKLIPELIKSLELIGKERDNCKSEFREYLRQQDLERKQWREIAKGAEREVSLTLFVRMLNQGSSFHRRHAIQTLGLMGPGAKPAILEVRKALNDSDKDTRRMAAEAIRQIQRIEK